MVINCQMDTVRLHGNLRSNLWPTIRSAACMLLQDHPKGIYVVCSDLEQVSGDGFRTFTDAAQEILGRNLPITLCGLPTPVVDAMSRAAHSRALPMAPSLEEARLFAGLIR